jgi:hypothetical protein
MRPSGAFFFLVISSASAVAIVAQIHPPPKISPKIHAAKTVFFNDQTGVPAVGKNALAQLENGVASRSSLTNLRPTSSFCSQRLRQKAATSSIPAAKLARPNWHHRQIQNHR